MTRAPAKSVYFDDSKKYLFATSSIINNAPAGSGVYVIWDGHDVCL
jgi:hypothetical protein